MISRFLHGQTVANDSQLCKVLEWEDEGIKEHVSELLARIHEVVPDNVEKEEDDDEEVDEEEWESGSDVDDEEMKDS